MLLVNRGCSMASVVNRDLMDRDYNYIMYEFNMNYSLESLRRGYLKSQKEEKERVSDDVLRSLGYSDSDILKRND